ncbi:S10AG protein, partial [Ptilorrhoa leucosticta]|nr:S10AG protein [Ptilorrhoa leucosticta]
MADCRGGEWAVQVLVNNFDKGGGRCCCCKNPRRISKKGFRKMLSRELNHMLRGGAGAAGPGSRSSPAGGAAPLSPQDTGNRRAADKRGGDLDENKDGRISFEGGGTLIGGIASPIAQMGGQQEQSVKHTK